MNKNREKIITPSPPFNVEIERDAQGRERKMLDFSTLMRGEGGPRKMLFSQKSCDSLLAFSSKKP